MVTVIGVNQNLIKYVHLQKMKECCLEKQPLCAKTERRKKLKMKLICASSFQEAQQEIKCRR